MDSRVSHILAGVLGGLLAVAGYMLYDAATTLAAVVDGGKVELAQSARTERREEQKKAAVRTPVPGAPSVVRLDKAKDVKKDVKPEVRKDGKVRDPERIAARRAERADEPKPEGPRVTVDRAASLYAEFEARRAAGEDVRMRDLVDQARSSGERVRVRDMKAARDKGFVPRGAPIPSSASVAPPVPASAPPPPLAVPEPEPYAEEEDVYYEEEQ